ncbi:SusD/RagB family nutrient-binding outer membrane lipoprotein [Capnocytophaga gingivalis]|uniref:SusD/RagB family nutrient-binding outer membrane lipoprotein n=1 Tax=Capnocytophaga gingivalis TaxID=1017 RepID=A0A250FMX2_9FLAO|nr:SusD/RagB family nutrient-binding outer membrane lipoprotein [Capnocytophaga gingivalis]ATA86443.1 SusD/RagB family nutrient-binding outer membrane lipoprotein [Capnocytophaga gingivalis]
MKRLAIIILGGLALLGTTTSCQKDFEEINTNPNRPQQALPTALFNGSTKLFLKNTRNYTTSGMMFRSWMQYTAQDTYTKESRFLYRDYAGDYLWRYPYQVAGGYKDIIDLNTDPKTKELMATYGKSENQIAAARIMLAYTFALLVETFGDVPYYSYGSPNPERFQALQLEKYISPVYATQKEIYTDLLKELKEAAAQIVSDSYVFKEGDYIFETPDKMRRFANSLRLRLAIRLKDVSDTELRTLAQQSIDELKAGTAVMQSEADTVELQFDSDDTNPAPIYKEYFVSNRVDYSPSNSFVQLLKGQRGNFGVDPRLQKYFAPKGLTKYQARDGRYTESDNLNDYIGMPYGLDESMADFQFKSGVAVSFFSSRILQPNYAEVFMEYSEVCFLLSEANGWDNTWYKKGVEASMKKWGVNSTKITNFLNTIPAANEENVLTQKYIALYMNPNEAWAEYRRTGYPHTLIKVNEETDLNIPTEAGQTKYRFESLVADLTDIPERLFYPVAYKVINEANYQKALESMQMTTDILTKRLIFDRGQRRP